MKNFACVFPGQGSQHIGMAKNLYDNYSLVQELYSEASEMLGYDTAKLCFEGPKEDLDKTVNTQPMLLLASISAYAVFVLNDVTPDVVAGHSLGEYTALLASGVFNLNSALKITHMRGRVMQEAVPEGQGLMAAILGLDRAVLDEVCLSITSGLVAAANYNCPGQIVISGERVAVEEAMVKLKTAGAKRAIPLSVSVPSHSALMDGASKKLSEFFFFDDTGMSEPKIPIVSNADAIYLTSTNGLKAALVKQLNHPVLWEDSVRTMLKHGITTFVEVGPGTVLSGLIKRIEPTATLMNVQDTDSLKATLHALKEN